MSFHVMLRYIRVAKPSRNCAFICMPWHRIIWYCGRNPSNNMNVRIWLCMYIMFYYCSHDLFIYSFVRSFIHSFHLVTRVHVKGHNEYVIHDIITRRCGCMLHLYICSSVTVGVKGKESQQRVIMTLWLKRPGEILITPDILQNCWVAWGCMGCLWCWGIMCSAVLIQYWHSQ